MKRRKERLKLYMEAGLAVLLVVGLAAGGRAGLFEKAVNAAEELTQAAQGDVGTDAGTAEGGAENGAADASAGAEEAIADGQYPIMGSSSVTTQEMVDYFNASGETYPSEALSRGGADSIETFCQMYYDEACAEGVRPEVAFAQTMKETGFLQYGGDASIEQFNFAGLGTTGGGVPGNSYPDVRTGIRAQIQHLKGYATTDALSQECVDDRYEYVKKGSAPYVEWLGQQENPEGVGWATGDNYGYDIVSMIREMRGG
jgi:hypothetical protein